MRHVGQAALVRIRRATEAKLGVIERVSAFRRVPDAPRVLQKCSLRECESQSYVSVLPAGPAETGWMVVLLSDRFHIQGDARNFDSHSARNDSWVRRPPSTLGRNHPARAIVFYVAVISARADNLGIRYLLPIFPLLFVWVSRIVPDYWPNRLRRVLLIALLGWQMWAALSTFPNYIPYFNELAGGARRGTDILDDSNVDWGQALKQAAAYVKEKGIDNVVVCSFSPFDNPPYYGLPPTSRHPRWQRGSCRNHRQREHILSVGIMLLG